MSKDNKIEEKLLTEDERNKNAGANEDEQKIELKNDYTNNTNDNNNMISYKLKNLDVSDRDLDDILLENFTGIENNKKI